MKARALKRLTLLRMTGTQVVTIRIHIPGWTAEQYKALAVMLQARPGLFINALRRAARQPLETMNAEVA